MDPIVFGNYHKVNLDLFNNKMPSSTLPNEVEPADIAAEIEMQNIMKQAKLARKLRRRELRNERDTDSSTIVSSIQDTSKGQEPFIESQSLCDYTCQSTTEFDMGENAESTPTMDSVSVQVDMDEIVERARSTQVPHICLVGPSQFDRSSLSEWNRFCKHAIDVRMLHKEHDQHKYIAVINGSGQMVVFENEWLDWILRNGKTRAIYVSAFMDKYTMLQSLQHLRNGASALVYDPLCDKCQDALLAQRYGTIIPRDWTQMQEPCVVQRKNEMLHIFKL